MTRVTGIQATISPSSCRNRQGRTTRASRRLIPAISVLAIILTTMEPAQSQTSGSATVRPSSPAASAGHSTGDSDSVIVIVDGRLVSAEAVEIRRATQVMVWLRDLERIGWGTIETGPGDEIRLKGKSATLQFQKNGGIARVNSLAVRLPIDTYLKDGKLMVPLSFVAKALGFEYETSTRTVAYIRTAPPKPNSVSGRVIYNGAGEQGIVVRAVDPSYIVVKNVSATTDDEGRFTLSPLPDGRFMAYVYTGDNPGYFLRASEAVEVKGGSKAEVGPIVLGRIVHPEKPLPGAGVSLSKPQIDFSWTDCAGAVSYRLKIASSGKPEVDVMTKTTSTSLASSKFKQGTSYLVEVSALNQAGEVLGGTASTGSQQWTFSAVK